VDINTIRDILVELIDLDVSVDISTQWHSHNSQFGEYTTVLVTLYQGRSHKSFGSDLGSYLSQYNSEMTNCVIHLKNYLESDGLRLTSGSKDLFGEITSPNVAVNYSRDQPMSLSWYLAGINKFFIRRRGSKEGQVSLEFSNHVNH
jgi:hypothetical protein